MSSSPQPPAIPGYDYGKPALPPSPVTLEELRQLEQSTGWSEADADILHRHRQIFEDRAEEMVDAWRAVIGSQPHLAKWFFDPNGKPDDAYKAAVKKRFVQWVKDVANRSHDQQWLDYQEEIGLRHTPQKKNVTDNAHTPPVVPLRYLYSFVAIVAVTTRPFFTDSGLNPTDLQKLEDAWLKAVILHITLWSRPYCKEGLW